MVRSYIRKIIDRVIKKHLVDPKGIEKYIQTLMNHPDASFAQNVINTEIFRNHIALPIPIELGRQERICIIAPHQDDEIIGTGGLIMEAKSNGYEIIVVFATDGGQKGIAETIKESVKIRKNEAESILDSLGVNYQFIGISNYSMQITRAHIIKLKNILTEFNPSIIATPWILDLPKKHRLVNNMLAQVLNKMNLTELRVLGYQVHNNIIPNRYLDISKYLKDKVRFTKQYKSQIRNFKRYDLMVEGMAKWNLRFLGQRAIEDQIEGVELFTEMQSKSFARLMKQYSY